MSSDVPDSVYPDPTQLYPTPSQSSRASAQQDFIDHKPRLWSPPTRFHGNDSVYRSSGTSLKQVITEDSWGEEAMREEKLKELDRAERATGAPYNGSGFRPWDVKGKGKAPAIASGASDHGLPHFQEAFGGLSGFADERPISYYRHAPVEQDLGWNEENVPPPPASNYGYEYGAPLSNGQGHHPHPYSGHHNAGGYVYPPHEQEDTAHNYAANQYAVNHYDINHYGGNGAVSSHEQGNGYPGYANDDGYGRIIYPHETASLQDSLLNSAFAPLPELEPLELPPPALSGPWEFYDRTPSPYLGPQVAGYPLLDTEYSTDPAADRRHSAVAFYEQHTAEVARKRAREYHDDGSADGQPPPKAIKLEPDDYEDMPSSVSPCSVEVKVEPEEDDEYDWLPQRHTYRARDIDPDFPLPSIETDDYPNSWPGSY